MEEIKLKPCPFCGGDARMGISDDEGNMRDSSYLLNPWSGLSFHIKHNYDQNPDCPIANFNEDGGMVGVALYDSMEAAAEAWNTRVLVIGIEK